jgi:flavin-dependent dehydrogenase
MGEQGIPGEIDLVIIGGGPAGLSTALFLLQLDLEWADRLFILEKETHPRQKLCAGGITHFGRRMLEELGLRLSIPYVPISKASLEFGCQTAALEGDPIFIVTERRAFDAWLADQARLRGIRVIQWIPARSLAWEEDWVRVETKSGIVRAKAVVCAEGSKGRLRSWAMPQRRSTVAHILEVVVPAPHRHREFSKRQARFFFRWNYISPAGVRMVVSPRS